MKKTLTWLTLITIAGMLPLIILWHGLRSHYGVQRQAETQHIFEKMSDELDFMARYHEDQVFFHSLLQINFSQADKDNNSRNRLAEKVAAFKKIFPDSIRFIVWDKNGRLISELSDENRFQFILKTMFVLMHELAKLVADGSNIDLTEVAAVNSKMKLLRGYFGSFLFEKHLFEPLMPGHLGRCIFVSESEEKRLLWYYPGQNFSLACFIAADQVNRNTGAKMLIDRLSRQNKGFNTALLNPVTYNEYGLPEDLQEKTQIRLESENFAGNGVALRQSDDFILNFRQVSPDLVLVAWKRVKSLAGPEEKATMFILKSLRWLLVAIFVFYCIYLRMPSLYLSIQQKMLLLFIFSNGLPVLVLIAVGYEFFHEKKNDLINEAHQESLRVLKEFDLRFPVVKEDISVRFNRFIDAKNDVYGVQKWPESELESLKKLAREVNPEETIILCADGGVALYDARSAGKPESIVTEMLKQGLNFFNLQSKMNPGKKTSSILEDVSSDDLVLNNFLAFLDGFSVQSSAGVQRSTYLKFLGDRQQGRFWGILAVLWDHSAFMKVFIAGELNKLSAEIAPRIVGVMDKKSEKLFVSSPLYSGQIMRLLRQTRSRKLIMNDNIIVGGKSYLFTSISGNELSEGILMALYPRELIDYQVNSLKFLVIAVLILIILALLQIIRLFSRRLIVPVEGLAAGVEKIKQRDFSVRVNYLENDELGQLVSTFNQTAAGMNELAVGTAVQVGLLPPEKFSCGKIALFARSIFMSKMGGDYFDYFSLSDHRLGIFFGDVAGHGIPAAMVMAMVKAVVTSGSAKYSGPSELLSRAGLVLQHLKKRNWRRMMTAQCVEFNCLTGDFVFSSAGHCYPALISAGGKDCQLVKASGFPLGSSSMARRDEIAGCLKPGETLILYTDGIIEAVGPSGEMFDYARFTDLLKSAWNEDLEVYWQNILAGYYAWAAVQDDDLTLMMIRHGEVRHD